MKLELKRQLEIALCGYLPYGLRVLRNNPTTKGMSIEKMVGLNDNFVYFKNGGCIFQYIKPILHPLSDLTKEIEHNGEKFVPMEELFCLATKEDNPIILEWEVIFSKNVYGIRFKGIGLLFMYDPEFMCFTQSTIFKANHVGFQYQLFQKLFEWHFDVFRLIKQGLAININDLNKQNE